MSEIKLLPCPFCGGEAFISCDTEAPIDTVGRMWAYTVVCASCCARSGLCYSVEMAKKAWNTRKPMQEIMERLEELRTDYDGEVNSSFIDMCIDIVKGGVENEQTD